MKRKEKMVFSLPRCIVIIYGTRRFVCPDNVCRYEEQLYLFECAYQHF